MPFFTGFYGKKTYLYRTLNFKNLYIMRLFIFSICLAGLTTVIAQKNPYLLVGTYTSGKSEGIYVYSFDTKTGDNKMLSATKTSNPSYLAVSYDNKFVYAVNENADTTGTIIGGSVTAFAFNKPSATLTTLDKQLSGGTNPCYVAVDKTGKWVFAGNYSSGTLSVFPVKNDGSVEPASQVIAHSGTGPDKDRQEGPHVHSTVLSPDDKYLFVPNLGTDKIMIYRFDKGTGKLTPTAAKYAATKPGTGPRHFDFAPGGKHAYLAEELAGSVVAYSYKNGELKKLQEISVLQKGFSGATGVADIHVSHDGKFLYCSNRGDANLITIFAINPVSGTLKVAGYQSTLGKTPRNFSFDPTGNFLLAANQKSDDIIIFKVDKKTGLLTDTGKRIEVPNPVCIKWIE